MKKLMTLAALTGLAIVLLAGASFAYAQANDLSMSDLLSGVYKGPAADVLAGYGPQEGAGDGEGLLHDYIHGAIAEALGLTVDELDAMLADGMTLVEIVEAQGLTLEEFQDLLDAAMAEALAQAVADGVISQTQADHMLLMGFPFFRGEDAPAKAMWGYQSPGQHGLGSFGSGGDPAFLLAEFTGLNQEQLQTRLQNGETVAEILAAAGMSTEDFAAFAAEKRLAAVDEALANGLINQAQADAVKAQIQKMLENGWLGPFGPFGPNGVPGEGGPAYGEPGMYGPGDSSGPYGVPGEGGPGWGESGEYGPGGHHGQP